MGGVSTYITTFMICMNSKIPSNSLNKGIIIHSDHLSEIRTIIQRIIGFNEIIITIGMTIDVGSGWPNLGKKIKRVFKGKLPKFSF